MESLIPRKDGGRGLQNSPDLLDVGPGIVNRLGGDVVFPDRLEGGLELERGDLVKLLPKRLPPA